jgi:hypothetical protein
MQGFEKTAQKPLSSKLVSKENDILVTVKDNDRKIMDRHDKHGPVVHGPLHCFHQKILLVVASCFEYCLDIGVQDDVGLHAQCIAAQHLSAHIRYCIVAASSHSASQFANHSAFYFVTLLAVHDLHIVHAQLFVKYLTMVGVGVALFHPQVHAQLVAVQNQFEDCIGMLAVAGKPQCAIPDHLFVDELSHFGHDALMVAEKLHLRRTVKIVVVAEHF